MVEGWVVSCHGSAGFLTEGHFFDVDKVHWADVFRRGTAAPGAAAQRERWEEARAAAGAAHAAASVDKNAGSWLAGKFKDDVSVFSVQAHGVADAVLQQFNAEVAGFVPILDHIERQYRCQLFIGKRIAFADAALCPDQHCGVGRDADSSSACDHLW